MNPAIWKRLLRLFSSIPNPPIHWILVHISSHANTEESRLLPTLQNQVRLVDSACHNQPVDFRLRRLGITYLRSLKARARAMLQQMMYRPNPSINKLVNSRSLSWTQSTQISRSLSLTLKLNFHFPGA